MTFVKNLVRCIDSNNKSRFKKSHPTTYNYNNSIALLNYCTFVLCGTHSMWFFCWAQSCTHPKCIYSNMNENSRSQPFVKNAHTQKFKLGNGFIQFPTNFSSLFKFCCQMGCFRFGTVGSMKSVRPKIHRHNTAHAPLQPSLQWKKTTTTPTTVAEMRWWWKCAFRISFGLFGGNVRMQWLEWRNIVEYRHRPHTIKSIEHINPDFILFYIVCCVWCSFFDVRIPHNRQTVDMTVVW